MAHPEIGGEFPGAAFAVDDRHTPGNIAAEGVLEKRHAVSSGRDAKVGDETGGLVKSRPLRELETSPSFDIADGGQGLAIENQSAYSTPSSSSRGAPPASGARERVPLASQGLCWRSPRDKAISPFAETARRRVPVRPSARDSGLSVRVVKTSTGLLRITAL